MKHAIKTCLAQADLFDNLSDEQLDRIAAIAESAVMPKDFVLIEEKDSSNALFVVVSGSVDIWLNPAMVSSDAKAGESVKVAELLPGQVFGEIALVDQGIRSATVKTNQDNTEVLRLPSEALLELCQADLEMGYKLMKNLAADLALKMRNTGLTLRQYQLMLAKQA